jgi:hypothetical protein
MPSPTPLSPVQLQALELLCRTLASEKSLLRWFTSLDKLPSNLRSNAIIQITTDMRRGDEDPALIGAICCLSDPVVYQAATAAVSELSR